MSKLTLFFQDKSGRIEFQSHGEDSTVDFDVIGPRNGYYAYGCLDKDNVVALKYWLEQAINGKVK